MAIKVNQNTKKGIEKHRHLNNILLGFYRISLLTVSNQCQWGQKKLSLSLFLHFFPYSRFSFPGLSLSLCLPFPILLLSVFFSLSLFLSLTFSLSFSLSLLLSDKPIGKEAHICLRTNLMSVELSVLTRRQNQLVRTKGIVNTGNLHTLKVCYGKPQKSYFFSDPAGGKGLATKNKKLF